MGVLTWVCPWDVVLHECWSDVDLWWWVLAWSAPLLVSLLYAVIVMVVVGSYAVCHTSRVCFGAMVFVVVIMLFVGIAFGGTPVFVLVQCVCVCVCVLRRC